MAIKCKPVGGAIAAAAASRGAGGGEVVVLARTIGNSCRQWAGLHERKPGENTLQAHQ